QLVAPDENVGPAEDLDRIRSGDVLQIVDEAAAGRHAVALDAHALVHAADLHAIETEAFTDDPHAAGATSVDHGVLDPQSHGPAGVDSVAARMGELDDAVADDDVGPGHPDPTNEVDPVEHLARTELQR